MDRRIASFLFAAMFLALAEAGMRAIEPRVATRSSVDRSPESSLERDPLILFTGTSRTLYGLVPRVMERELEAASVSRPWVATVTRRGRTQVGFLQLYEEEIAPLCAKAAPHGAIGLEVADFTLNDSLVFNPERAFLASVLEGAGRGLEGRSRGRAVEGESNASGVSLKDRLDRIARVPFQHLRLATRGSDLSRFFARLVRSAPEGAGLPADHPASGFVRAAVERRLEWTSGAKGFRENDKPVRPDKNASGMRALYEGTMLRDYATGGPQTTCLRILIRRCRRDGFRPFLYIMPVMPVHRQFASGRPWREFRALADRVATEEGVPLIDLDRDHGLPEEMFRDTNHLLGEGCEVVSRRMARELRRLVLVPDRTSGIGGGR